MVNREMTEYSRIKLTEVDSTNAYALEHIGFFDDKTVIYTPHQASGRGRYNRKWISDGSENIYMSIVLKPKDTSDYPYSNLTQYLSVILCRLLKSEFELNGKIKWPNDILVDGSKISGILAEADTKNGKIDGIVLGVGLNVNLKPETLETIDQRATSISVLKDENYDTDVIADKLVNAFFSDYDEFIEKGFNFIKDEYVSKCDFLGKEISIREEGEKKKFTALSIDDDGLLTVKDENNNISKIITGDILC